MPEVVWNSPNSGDWSTPEWLLAGSDPQQFVVPDTTDDAVANGTSLQPITITFTGSGAAKSLSMAFATLDVQGGLLTLVNASGLDALTQEGGTLDFGNTAGGGSDIGGNAIGGVTQTGGTLQVDAGALVLQGAIALAGSATGAGDLEIGGFGIATIDAGAIIAAATFELGVAGNGTTSQTTLAGNLDYTGDFLLDNFSGNSAQLMLAGQTLTLHGQATLDGSFVGPGTVTIDGTAVAASGGFAQLDTTGGANLVVNGTVNQTLNVSIGADLAIAGTWDITSDAHIANGGSASITNAGLFEKTGGTGDSFVGASFVNTGSILVGVASLDIEGAVTTSGQVSGAALRVDGSFDNTGAGTVDVQTLLLRGGGTLDGDITVTGDLALTNVGAYTLEPTATLTPGTLEIDDTGTSLTLLASETFDGSFALNSGTVDAGNFNLTLNGPATLGRDLIVGTGTVAVANGIAANFTLGGSATLLDTGVITQTSGIALGRGHPDVVTLVVPDATTYDIAAGVWLGNPNLNTTGDATIDNAGLFEMTGTGAANLYTALDSTGTLQIGAGGQIQLDSLTASLGGTVSGAGALLAANTWTLLAGAVVTVATFENNGAGTLAGGLTYSRDFLNDPNGSLDIGANALTLDGTASLSGEIGGPTGTLSVANATAGGFTLGGSATLDDTGLITQTGGVALGQGNPDTATLNVLSSATYDIASANWLGNPNLNTTGVATVNNAGLFEMTGTGAADIFTAFNNTGTLSIDSGGQVQLDSVTASLGGDLTGAGALYLGNSWTLLAGATLGVASLETNGAGTLAASFDYTGTFQSDGGASLNIGADNLTLDGTATLSGQMGGSGSILLANATVSNFAVGGSATLVDTGLVTQTASTDLGQGNSDSVTMQVLSGATYDMTQAVWLGNPNLNDTGISTIDNAGLFEMTGAGGSTVWHDIVNTGTVTTAPGGSLTFAHGFVNNGQVQTGAGTVAVNADVSGTGTVTMTNGGSFYVGGSVEAGQSLGFGGPGLFGIGTPADIGAAITGFAKTDTIDLYNLSFDSSGTATLGTNDVLHVVEFGSTTDVQLAGVFTNGFTLSNDGTHHTDINLACFATGTFILTSRGEVPVEELRLGDTIPTLPGGRAAPVRWIGHRHVACHRHSKPADVWPVRVSAGAFGPGCPHRSLLLSPDHAVLVGEVLIPVRYLINDATIVQVPLDIVTYWHVELDRHAILVADGMPAESYLDTGNRSAFENSEFVEIKVQGLGPWRGAGQRPALAFLIQPARQ